MVNNQLKNIKKEGSLARRKTHLKKKRSQSGFAGSSRSLIN